MPKNFPPSSPLAPEAPVLPKEQSNWPFLVIAVLMAMVLWLFVRTGGQPLNQRTVFLPISVTNAARSQAVAPSRVEVRLEAATTMIDRLSPDEVAVMADLAGHKEGDLVPLSVVPPQGFKVLSASVTQVRVVQREPASP